ncbi:hypothetical protein [Amantichitinum ursilacus]|uniref:Uncharacterized protein n=1 Tax=Amantichitinum ursilacus TaxID=857265 RepID=A0A0N0GL70_9NEIS|nr:hypothetical protein [Amantichitinum ursilacus]KPC49627.1 hypothetical protein WG78_19930 [Amantichitinum ursilacus]
MTEKSMNAGQFAFIKGALAHTLSERPDHDPDRAALVSLSERLSTFPERRKYIRLAFGATAPDHSTVG